MSENNQIDTGALIHSSAGIIALVLGGLMFTHAWAQPLFAGLMLLSAVSALWISWRQNAWVTGHWLAMLPVLGVFAGGLGSTWGYAIAYVSLWLAFAHFVYRGYQSYRGL